MDYATKLIVFLSVATAILLEAFLSARAWPNQLPLTIAAFFVTALSSLALAELSAAIVLFLIFLMPAVLLVVHGDYSVVLTGRYGWQHCWARWCRRAVAEVGRFRPGGRRRSSFGPSRLRSRGRSWSCANSISNRACC